MGVQGLWPLLESVARPVRLEALSNKVLAIDASIWLHHFLKAMRDHQGELINNAHLLGFLRRICKLLFFNIKPIVVFDGGAPTLKHKTLSERRKRQDRSENHVKRMAERIFFEQMRLRKRQDQLIQSKKEEPQEINTSIAMQCNPINNSNDNSALLNAETNRSDLSNNCSMMTSCTIQDEARDFENIEDQNDSEIEEGLLFGAIDSLDEGDIDIEVFQALPADIQYEIIQKMKSKDRKNRHDRVINVADNALEFSQMQIMNLVKKNEMTQKFDQVRQIISDQNKYMGMESKMIASDEAREYILMKNVLWNEKKSESMDAENNECKITNQSSVPESLPLEIEKHRNDREIIVIDDTLESAEEENEGNEEFIIVPHNEMALSVHTLPVLEVRFNPEDMQVDDLFDRELFDDASRHSLEDSSNIISVDGNELFHDNLPKGIPEICAISSQESVKIGHDFVNFQEETPRAVLSSESMTKISTQEISNLLEEEMEGQLEAIFPNWRSELNFLINEGSEAIEKRIFQIIKQKNGLKEFETKKFYDFYKNKLERLLQLKQVPKIEIEEHLDAADINLLPIHKQPEDFVSNKKGLETIKYSILEAADAVGKGSNNSALEINASSIKQRDAIVELDISERNVPQDDYFSVFNDDSFAEQFFEGIDDDINDSTSQDLEKEISNIQFFLETELNSLAEYQKKTSRDNSCFTKSMIDECQELLRLFGIPYIVAPMEAEAQCAFLETAGLVEGIITDDSDVFLFGGGCIYRNMFSQNKLVECYYLADINRELHLSRDQLIDLAYLLGSDYTEGIPHIGVVMAMEIIHEFPGKDGLAEFNQFLKKSKLSNISDDLLDSPFKRKLYNSKREYFCPEQFPNPHIREAYIHPMVDENTDQFHWKLPDLDALRDFAHTKFSWNQSKIDEIVLPILRRLTDRQAQMTLNDYFGHSVISRRQPHHKSKRIQKVLQRQCNEDSGPLSSQPQVSSSKSLSSRRPPPSTSPSSVKPSKRRRRYNQE